MLPFSEILTSLALPPDATDLLLADAGGTSTDWLYLRASEAAPLRLRTAGMNPNAYDDAHLQAQVEAVAAGIGKELKCDVPPLAIAFYGAGCSGAGAERVREAIARVLRHTILYIGSDLELAARTLFGVSAGTACILGTGANSGFWDGWHFTHHTPPLGFILGDEGSGADLGRELLRRVLRGELPATLAAALQSEGLAVSEAEAIQRIYRQSGAAAYLGSFVPFIASHANDAVVASFVEERFRMFLQRHVVPYGEAARRSPIGFVGGAVFALRRIMQRAAAAEGLQVGRILPAPLAAFV